MTEGKMVRWHHRLNGHEFEQALGDSEGQGSLACCSPWGYKELDTTERLNNNGSLMSSTHLVCRVLSWNVIKILNLKKNLDPLLPLWLGATHSPLCALSPIAIGFPGKPSTASFRIPVSFQWF